jgi:hypothetical protein
MCIKIPRTTMKYTTANNQRTYNKSTVLIKFYTRLRRETVPALLQLKRPKSHEELSNNLSQKQAQVKIIGWKNNLQGISRALQESRRTTE